MLIDNGSAMNVLPAKMMSMLHIDPITLKPSNMTIKAYDSTSRTVLGIASLDLWFGGKQSTVEFQVIDIPVTFSALLGRPWLHKMGAVASTLHQCVKFVQDGTLTIMYGDSITVEGTDDSALPLMEIQLDDPNLMLSGFRVEEPKAQICTIDLTIASDKIPPAMRMMRHMNYIPGLGLGKRLQGLHQLINVETRKNRDGLGYVITDEDKQYDKTEALKARMAAAAGKTYRKPDMRPYSLSLNKYFVKGGNEMYVCPEARFKQMGDRMEVIRKIVASPDPINEMLANAPKGPDTVITHEHEYHFWGDKETIDRFSKLTLEEPVVAKIRNADAVEVDESLAQMFGAMDISVEAEGDRPSEAEPLIVLATDDGSSGGVVVQDQLDLIDFSSGHDLIAVVEFGSEKEIDPRTFVPVSEMPLKNWKTIKGPVADREMLLKLGLKPRPAPSESSFKPFVLRQSSESLIVEFESSVRSDVLTTDDHRRVVETVFPFALNKMVDLSSYPLIATLTNDKLTNNEHNDLKLVNNDSFEEETDTLDEQYEQNFTKQVINRGESRVQAADEVLTTVNLGTAEEPKETQIGEFFKEAEQKALVDLLKEYVDVFAWSYQDMPGLDPNIVEHRIPLDPDAKPIKQKLRRIKPEWSLQVKEEIEKLLRVGFIRVIEYPEWLANIVTVSKSNGKVRVCVDFRDLNKASPKDDFPLPNIDMLVDSTANYEVKSFVDGFAGYNQIKMAKKDQEKTAFITTWGTYCYTVMPFGLKNAGATYQRAVTALFHDMIHKEIEVYVDDMIIHSKGADGQHLIDLRKFFNRLREHEMRLNPAKCTFGVVRGKVLGYMITERGIEVDPKKIKAIIEMKPPTTVTEVKAFMGRLQYISRFVNQLTTICEPIFRLLKKNQEVIWSEECQAAFEKIKQYLVNPPILCPPHREKPLLLYLTVTDTAVGAMLAQEKKDSKVENAIYFVSRKLQGSELNYSALEKTCTALVWVVGKLKHYMMSHTVHLVSKMDPIKYIFDKPSLSTRLAKWSFFLAEFDIKYMTRKAIKGQVLADHLADFPSSEDGGPEPQFPDDGIFMLENDGNRWQLFFDGASNKRGQGIGMVLVDPSDAHTPIAIKLNFSVTNNAAEYEACIAGLEAALERNIYELEVYGDSQLIINQVSNKWKTVDPQLQKYHLYMLDLIGQFKEITFNFLATGQKQIRRRISYFSFLGGNP